MSDQKAAAQTCKICPLLILSPNASPQQNYKCIEEDCAWWIQYTQTSNSKHDCCAIQMLGYLSNIR